MQNRLTQTLRYLAVGMIVALASGCGARAVVDENGKPLAGVHVVAEWWADGPGFYSNQSHCVRLEAMVTGADGKFDFPFFSGNFNPRFPERQRNIKFFKAGYELVPKQIEGSDPVKLRPFSGDPKQRFEDDYYIYSIQCEGYEKKLYPVLKEIYTEARLIAKTKEQKLQVRGNYEYRVNLQELGEAGAQAKAQKAMERRTRHISCGSGGPEDFTCCFGFADSSRTPLFAEILKKEKIEFRLKNNSVCVDYAEQVRVQKLQSTTPYQED